MSGLIFVPKFAPYPKERVGASSGPVVQLLGSTYSMLARTEDDRLFITGYKSENATEAGIGTPYWKEATILESSSGEIKDFADDKGLGGFRLIRGVYNYACGPNTYRKLGLDNNNNQQYTGGFHRSNQNSFGHVVLTYYYSFLWGHPSNHSSVAMYGKNTNLGMSGSNTNTLYFNNTMTRIGDITAMASTAVGATARAVRNNLYLRGSGYAYQQNSSNTGNVNSDSITYSLPDTPSNYIVKIVAGFYHFLMLTAGGDVYSWGYNSHGQLGQGTTANSPIAKIMSNAKDISASGSGGVVLTNNNEVYHFGTGFNGNTANTSGKNLSPFRMSVPEGEIEAAVSTDDGIALLINGFIYTKGANTNGTLGTHNSNEWTMTDPSNM